MKKIYHLYEGIALLLVVVCGWQMVLRPSEYYVNYFSPLQDQLNQALTKAHQDNRQVVKSQVWHYQRLDGASREGRERYQRLIRLHKKTNVLTTRIENLKGQLQKSPLHNQSTVKALMIDQHKGDSLKYWLNQHVDWLINEHKDLDLPKFDKLAEGNQQNPLYANDLSQAYKGFAEANFAHTPVVMALGILTLKQFMLRRYEREVRLRMDITCGSYYAMFPWVYAYASPPSTTIQVGDDYISDMFIGRELIAASPAIYYNARFSPDAFPEEQLTFKVKGKGKQVWQGRLKYQYQGQDTTIHYKTFYTIYPSKKQANFKTSKQ